MADWNKISYEEFEQLCYEIISSEGFYNITRLGGTGDRGRDLIAEKLSPLLHGSNEVQRWIIQCKRYTTTKLTIEDLAAELNKVRMHKPDYYLLLITNALNPNLYDWLQQVKTEYSFKIHIFGVDWLENQLQKSPLLYKRFFEKNDTYSHLFRVNPNTDLQIYTAGKMPTEAIRNSITWWRKELQNETKMLQKKIGFYHPEFAGCDHTGIYLSETVQTDFGMISQSDLVIAYLENREQFGTITEIMIAYSMNKQLAIFIDEDIKTEIKSNEYDEITEVNMDYYGEVYEKVFETNHICPCDLMNELKPIHMNNYWFMIEFLRLRQPNAHIQMTTKNSVIKDMYKYIEQTIK
ncbi:restriction endonuclease [Flavobacterium soli]|uniref:restriction endonuclease n=1 Tax=Flavobacterium soli TaxID=344881 RepID=UPI00040AA6D0|nr:restriction endonuclease [Flavobacterium soli]